VRTLLGQDVGEVRDAAHVTDVATGYLMLQAGGDTLMLWDTPGFGDTARLLKRLKLSGNPLGWFLTQVWDRWRERPLWSSQQAVRNARDHADIILYLVNASEDPADAGYVALEMEILAWVGKPVLLLLNQTGPPRAGRRRRGGAVDPPPCRATRSSGRADARRLCPLLGAGRHLAAHGPAAPAARRSRRALARLEAAWQEKNLERFHPRWRCWPSQLAEAAVDRETVPEQNWQDKVGGAIRSLGREEPPEARRAVRKLAERLEAGTRARPRS
jgi:hypothetical protein